MRPPSKTGVKTVIEIKTSARVPESEWDAAFLQGMVDRMITSFHKYGSIADAYPRKIDALKSLRNRLRKYERTGNTEWLIDVANFAMIEFAYPARADAHYRSTSSEESPGRQWRGERDLSTRSNREH